MESLTEAYTNINDLVQEANSDITAANLATTNALATCTGISTALCDQVRANAVTLNLMCLPFVDCNANPLATGCNTPRVNSNNRESEGRVTKYAVRTCAA